MRQRYTVTVCHNILWSKYKGVVFSQLEELSRETELHFSFIQIAETEGDRIGLGGVDMSYHTYAHELLFGGAYDDISSWRIARALIAAVRRSEPDLVILPGYEKPEYWALLFYCVLTRTRRAVFCDSTDRDRPAIPWRGLAKRFFFSLCNGFFAYGERARQYLINLGARQSAVYFPCQAAALPHTYSPANAYESRILARRKCFSSEFLYIGRLSKEKDLPTLLRAFDVVCEALPDSELTLVGAGPEEGRLRALHSQLKHGAHVRFVGSESISQIAARLSSALALVLPSRSEPWGLVVNEALSYGCPVIVSEACGCVPELVQPEVSGFSFQEGSVDALVDAMKRVHRLTSEDEAGVAKACIDLMKQFTPSNAANQIMRGCRELLQ